MPRTAVAFIVGLCIGAVAFSATPQSLAQTNAPSTARTSVLQLRIFTADQGRLDDLSKAWLAGVYPLRLKLGYQIPFAGKIPSTNQFVWLVSYSGPETWQQKEDQYYASDDRKHLSPDPAQWIAHADELMVTPLIAPR